MPFKIEIELRGARLTGHDHFWSVIRELGAGGGEFTIGDVVMQTAAHKDTVGDFIRRLTRTSPPIAEPAGWRQVPHGNSRAGKTIAARTYRLLRTPRETPSLTRDGREGAYGRGRQHMWNILRGSQARAGIDARELVMLAETAEVPIAVASAKEFLRRLEAAGILHLEAPAANGRLARYRLRPGQNLGPKAPRLLKARFVYDPNHRALVGTAVAEEVRS